MLAKNRRDRFLVVMRRRERRSKRTSTTTRKIGNNNNNNNTRCMDDWSLQSLGLFLSSMLTDFVKTRCANLKTSTLANDKLTLFHRIAISTFYYVLSIFKNCIIRECNQPQPSWVMGHYAMLYKYDKRTRDFLGAFLFLSQFSFPYFGGVVNKAIIQLAPVGHEMIVASPYPTRVVGRLTSHQQK